MSESIKRSSAFLLALVIGTLILYVGGEQKPAYLAAYGVIALVGIILSWNLSGMLKSEMPWYSPHIAVLTFMFLIEFAAPAAVILFSFQSNVYNRPLNPNEIFLASMVSLVGVAAYLIGWKIGPKRNTITPVIHRALSDNPQTRGLAPTLGVVLFVMSMAAWAYMYKTVGGISMHMQNMGGGRIEMIQTSGGFVWHIARFGYAGTLMYFAVKGPKSIPAWVMIGLLAVMLTLFGSRSYLMILLLGVLITYRMRFTKRTPKTLLIVVCTVFFFVATFLVQLRSTRGRLDEAQTVYLDLLNNIDGFVYLLFGHLSFIIQRAELMQHLNETGDYQYGRSYLNLLHIIPGVIWPAKYEVLPPTGAQYYVETFFPRRVGKISLSNNLFTEMYLNFAWPGVVVGGIIFGFTIRWIHSRLIVPAGRYNHVIVTVGIALMAMSWFRLIKSGSPVMITMFYLLFPLIILALLNFAIGRPTTNQPR